jgi:hypothetical protein
VVIRGTQKDRAISNHRIKPGGQEDTIGCQSLIETLAPNPLGVGVRSRPGTNGKRDLLDATKVAYRRKLLLQASENRMHVAITKAVANEPTCRVNDLVGMQPFCGGSNG